MITVYNAKGEPVTVDSVDAREYVESGRWSYDPPAPKESKPAKEVKQQANKLAPLDPPQA